MHDALDELEGAAAPRRLIGVRVREGGRADDYLVEGLELHVGDHCVVEVPSGHAVGQVRRPARDVPAFKQDRAYPRVLRLATPEEVAEGKRRRERELGAMRTVPAPRPGPRTSPEGRRRRDDAGRPAGDRALRVRDADGLPRAGARPGAGVPRPHRDAAGRRARRDASAWTGSARAAAQLCCSSHLRGFEPISVKMAKAQDMPLTDSRLLGNCGRLKCCLLYEFSHVRGAARAAAARGLGLPGRLRRRGLHDGQGPGAPGPQAERCVVGFPDGTEAEVPLDQLTGRGARTSSGLRHRDVRAFYLTTPIYYVNARAAPRARVHDHRGRRDGALPPAAPATTCASSPGTDEHGDKIAQAAAEGRA